MFVAKERREAILAFAERKFALPASGDGENDVFNEPLEIIKAMAEIDSQSQSFYMHLSPLESRSQSQKNASRLQSMTA